MLLILLLSAVLGLLYFYFTLHFSHWKDKNVKYIKGYPLVGSMLSVITLRVHMTDFFRRIYYEHRNQPFVGYFQGRIPALVIQDPNIVKQILVKDFSHFTDHGLQINKDTDPLLAFNLFNMDGHEWKEMRAKLSPTFTSGRMKTMFPSMYHCAQTLEQYLGKLADEGTFVDAKDICGRYTTNVIAASVFGVDCDAIADPDVHFRVMGRKLLETSFMQGVKVAIISFVPELNKIFRPTFFDRKHADYFRALIRDVIALRMKTGEKRNDFMDLLIQLKNQGHLSPEEGQILESEITQKGGNKKLTEDEVMAQAMVFFFAGFETSSSTLSFALFDISRRPDIQKRARQEIEQVLQKHDGQLTYQSLLDMKYLDWILQESLRKYPSLSALLRVCTKDYVIPDTKVKIEKGTPLFIPIQSIQNDPQYFPNPEEFRPERFEDETQKSQFIHLPFGEGPRQCIGMRFAYMQSKLALVSLLRKFEVRPSAGLASKLTWDPRQFLLNANEEVIIQFVRV